MKDYHLPRTSIDKIDKMRTKLRSCSEELIMLARKESDKYRNLSDEAKESARGESISNTAQAFWDAAEGIQEAILNLESII